MLNSMLGYVFLSGLRDRTILDWLFDVNDIDLYTTFKIALAITHLTTRINDIINKQQASKDVGVCHGKKILRLKNKNLEMLNQKKSDEISCSRCNAQTIRNVTAKLDLINTKFDSVLAILNGHVTMQNALNIFKNCKAKKVSRNGIWNVFVMLNNFFEIDQNKLIQLHHE